VLIAACQVSPCRESEPGNGWNLTSALAAIGVDVHVITGAGWRSEIVTHGRPGNGLTFHYVSRRALPRGFRSGQRSVYAEYLAWQRGCLEAAVRLDAEHDFDVAHHLNWGSLFCGSSLSRLGKPFVFGPIGGGHTSPEVLREWFGESRRLEANEIGLCRWRSGSIREPAVLCEQPTSSWRPTARQPHDREASAPHGSSSAWIQRCCPKQSNTRSAKVQVAQHRQSSGSVGTFHSRASPWRSTRSHGCADRCLRRDW